LRVFALAGVAVLITASGLVVSAAAQTEAEQEELDDLKEARE